MASYLSIQTELNLTLDLGYYMLKLLSNSEFKGCVTLILHYLDILC